jgi:hypothetical protein
MLGLLPSSARKESRNLFLGGKEAAVLAIVKTFFMVNHCWANNISQGFTVIP